MEEINKIIEENNKSIEDYYKSIEELKESNKVIIEKDKKSPLFFDIRSRYISKLRDKIPKKSLGGNPRDYWEKYKKIKNEMFLKQEEFDKYFDYSEYTEVEKTYINLSKY